MNSNHLQILYISYLKYTSTDSWPKH